MLSLVHDYCLAMFISRASFTFARSAMIISLASFTFAHSARAGFTYVRSAIPQNIILTCAFTNKMGAVHIHVCTCTCSWPAGYGKTKLYLDVYCLVK